MSNTLGKRTPLPNLRRNETRRIEWVSPADPNGWPQRIFLTIGYDEDALTPREVFYDEGFKTGSDIETLVRDLCIVLSVLLQHDGVSLSAFSSSLSRELNARTNEEEMGSVVGVLISELQRPPAWEQALNGESTPKDGGKDSDPL